MLSTDFPVNCWILSTMAEMAIYGGERIEVIKYYNRKIICR
jgi:hypothetical protein